MTTAEQREALTDRIIAEALASVRQRDEEAELVARLHELLEDTVAARREAWDRMEASR